MQNQWNLKQRQVNHKTGFIVNKSCQDGNTSGFEKPQQAEYLKLNSIPFTNNSTLNDTAAHKC